MSHMAYRSRVTPAFLDSSSTSSGSSVPPVAEEAGAVSTNDASQTAPDPWHHCAGNSALARDLNAQNGQGFDLARRKEEFLKKQKALKTRNIDVVIWTNVRFHNCLETSLVVTRIS